MRYRVKEVHVTPSYAEYTIQRRICFVWFDVTVDHRYLTHLNTAKAWVIKKQKGYPVTSYFYDS